MPISKYFLDSLFFIKEFPFFAENKTISLSSENGSDFLEIIKSNDIIVKYSYNGSEIQEYTSPINIEEPGNFDLYFEILNPITDQSVILMGQTENKKIKEYFFKVEI